MGQMLLKENNIVLQSITHTEFNVLSRYFEDNKERLYDYVENLIICVLKDYFSYTRTELSKMDGRTIASAFRNEEFCGNCIKRILE